MKAIILAAGRGSRMKGLTEERPKCLLELHGKPLLDWQLCALRDAGISEIGIVTGYMREKLATYELAEFHNSRWSETNMVASLACARDWLVSGSCIVSYSDIFYDSSAVISLMRCSADLAVTYDPNWRALWERRFGDPLIDAETFMMNDDHELLEIGKKPCKVEEIQGQYMGLLRITPKGWSEIERIRAQQSTITADKMDMTTTLQKVLEAKQVLIRAVPYERNWGEVDSEQDLALY